MAQSIYPTGVTLCNSAKVYPTNIIFDAPDGKTHLVDVNGRQLQQWDATGFPSQLLNPRLTGGKRGHLLVRLHDEEEKLPPASDMFRGLYGNRTIGELDWEGKVVWKWRLPDNSRQHHDWERLSNGNTLVLASVIRKVHGFEAAQSADQAFYEVAPTGEIVWSWYAGDHLEEFGFSPEELAVLCKSGATGPGFLSLNSLSTLGANSLYSAGDERFTPDNLIFTSRRANVVAIVSRDSGRIVWRLGPDYPSALSRQTDKRPVDQISAGQVAHIIGEGLPGAGNILLLDDQGPSGIKPVSLSVFGGSRVIEINPIARTIVWQYNAEASGLPAYTFHTFYGGNAQRLPNGNTLINAAFSGRIFQVTPEGDIVWEYINPYLGAHVDTPVPATRPLRDGFVNRVHLVPYDWMPANIARATPVSVTSYGTGCGRELGLLNV